MGISAALAFSAGSTLIGGITQAKAERKSGQYNQAVHDYNASVAMTQAGDALLRGEEAEFKQRRSTKRLIGSQRVAYAAQGIDVNEGSPVDVQADTAYLSELDVVTIRANAAREAWGYQAQAQSETQQGRIARTTANERAKGTILTAGARAIGAGFDYYNSRPSKAPAPTYRWGED